MNGNRAHRLSAFLPWTLLPAASSLAAAASPVPSTSAPITLRAANTVITFQINDDPAQDWTVAPEISPDTLRVTCSDNEQTTVVFSTESDTQSFSLSGLEFAEFTVLLADGREALTQVQCAPARLRFSGDYGTAPSPDRDLAADLNTGVLAEHVERMAAERMIPGLAVVVVQGEETVFQAAHGVVDLDTRDLFRNDTSVRLASATKVLTGLLILSLAEDGIIDLAEPLETYLADTPEAWRGIPLWRILNHTSGIPTASANPDFEALSTAEQAALTPRQLFDMLKGLPLDFEPGARMRYQQSAYAILAMAITERTGKTWDTLLTEHVFEPAGMIDTHYGDSSGVTPVTYLLENGGLNHPDYFYPRVISMGGGYNSTPNDIARLFMAINSDAIVSRDFLMSEIFLPDRISEGSGYSLATIVKSFGDTRLIGHSGGGGLADIRYAPGPGIGIAVFANRSSSDIAYDITDEISELLFGE